MVEIEVAVVGGLPVGTGQRALAEERPAVELEGFQQLVVAAEVIADRKLRFGIERHPDQPGAFVDREALEAMRGLVDRAKILRAGNADEVAVLLEGPAVVSAHEAAGIAGPFGQRIAAVGAHVEERRNPAVFLARQQQRHAADIHRLVIARLRQFAGRGDHQRQAAEDVALLALEQIGVGIGTRRNADDSVGIVHRTGSAVFDEVAGHGDQFIARHGSFLLSFGDEIARSARPRAMRVFGGAQGKGRTPRGKPALSGGAAETGQNLNFASTKTCRPRFWVSTRSSPAGRFWALPGGARNGLPPEVMT